MGSLPFTGPAEVIAVEPLITSIGPVRRPDGDLEGRNALALITDWPNAPKFKDLEQRHPSIRLVVLNDIAFYDPAGTAQYDLELIEESDFAASVRLQQEWIEHLATTARLDIDLPRVSITVGLSDPLEVNFLKSVEVPEGRRLSVADYFEISLEQDRTGDSFAVNGTFQPTGGVMAAGFDLQQRSPETIELGLEIRDMLASDAKLVVHENFITEASVKDGDSRRDILQAIEAACGTLEVFEFAAGTNTRIGSRLDWSKNSQINEGVLGFHLGVGNGIDGCHVDFVTEVDWRPWLAAQDAN